MTNWMADWIGKSTLNFVLVMAVLAVALVVVFGLAFLVILHWIEK